MDILYHGHNLEHWKNNAEEDYAKVPISVLKYISVLEDVVEFSFSKEKVRQLLYSFRDEIEDQQCSDTRINNFIEQNL